MISLNKLCDTVLICLGMMFLLECKREIEVKYYLVNESYNLAKTIFYQGRDSYEVFKQRALASMDTFIDVVQAMNKAMSEELRSSVIKFYKIRDFKDFIYYPISMEEVTDIIDHCLLDPVEKMADVSTRFHTMIKNFKDMRHFEMVDKCNKQLPDEVAAAHCILHQGVLFNVTIHDTHESIVDSKVHTFVQDINITLFQVRDCLNFFVPHFFDQLLVDAYTEKCGYMKIINASASDILEDKSDNRDDYYRKWNPLLKVLRARLMQTAPKPLFDIIFKANSSHERTAWKIK